MIHELAVYEREPDAARATLEDLRRDGFGETPRFHVLMARWGDAVAGFAFTVAVLRPAWLPWGRRGGPGSPASARPAPLQLEEEVNRVLDKWSREGEDSLTEAEKQVLEAYRRTL